MLCKDVSKISKCLFYGSKTLFLFFYFCFNFKGNVHYLLLFLVLLINPPLELNIH